ncbi:MAG TPA: hypothetical protein PLT25_11975, partial [Acidocella sp.]|nr:hypothetical protein [Acidocella sp.]
SRPIYSKRSSAFDRCEDILNNVMQPAHSAEQKYPGVGGGKARRSIVQQLGNGEQERASTPKPSHG